MAKYLDENGLAILNLLLATKFNDKVDKVEGKGLSTNDLTDELKNKILSAGDSSFDGQYLSLIGKPTINGIELKVGTTLKQLGIQEEGDYATKTDLDEKVDKVTGKGLSTNDFTTAEKNKLAEIETGAKANIIESIKVNGTKQTVTNKEINIAVPTSNSQLTNEAGYQTAAQVNALIQAVIGAAPEALDTLQEIANALNNDPDFSTTMVTELSKKINSADLVPLTNDEINAIFAS